MLKNKSRNYLNINMKWKLLIIWFYIIDVLFMILKYWRILMNTKRMSRFISVIEAINFIYFSRYIPKYFIEIINDISNPNTFYVIVRLLFILSILFTSFMYFYDKTLAYYLYFPQFVCRFLFYMTTFSYLNLLNILVVNQTLNKIIWIIIIVLEVIRLIYTIYMIFIKRRNLTTASTWYFLCHILCIRFAQYAQNAPSPSGTKI